jgi:hypothetical protein
MIGAQSPHIETNSRFVGYFQRGPVNSRTGRYEGAKAEMADAIPTAVARANPTRQQREIECERWLSNPSTAPGVRSWCWALAYQGSVLGSLGPSERRGPPDAWSFRLFRPNCLYRG